MKLINLTKIPTKYDSLTIKFKEDYINAWLTIPDKEMDGGGCSAGCCPGWETPEYVWDKAPQNQIRSKIYREIS